MPIVHSDAKHLNKRYDRQYEEDCAPLRYQATDEQRPVPSREGNGLASAARERVTAVAALRARWVDKPTSRAGSGHLPIPKAKRRVFFAYGAIVSTSCDRPRRRYQAWIGCRNAQRILARLPTTDAAGRLTTRTSGRLGCARRLIHGSGHGRESSSGARCGAEAIFRSSASKVLHFGQREQGTSRCQEKSTPARRAPKRGVPTGSRWVSTWLKWRSRPATSPGR